MANHNKKRRSYFKYKAPDYHKEHVKPQPAKVKPILRDTEVAASGYWVEKYGITSHALQRYVERFKGINNVDVTKLNHKEKVALHLELLAYLPEGFRNTNIPMKINLDNNYKAVINNKGIVITVMN